MYTYDHNTLSALGFDKEQLEVYCDILALTVEPENIISTLELVKNHESTKLTQLTDLVAIDYLHYGLEQWNTTSASNTGFSRGRNNTKVKYSTENRFSLVYNLLSIEHNKRLIVKTYLSENSLMVQSAIELFPSINWYEREAFDLFGIVFKGHPDLRRLLTDYGFIGHPFRKDFPLSGNVEVSYDASEERVVYKPIDLQPRELVPKVIRDDHRYIKDQDG
jgi:NADH-quinone oxidoreductase subunit C